MDGMAAMTDPLIVFAIPVGIFLALAHHEAWWVLVGLVIFIKWRERPPERPSWPRVLRWNYREMWVDVEAEDADQINKVINNPRFKGIRSGGDRLRAWTNHDNARPSKIESREGFIWRLQMRIPTLPYLPMSLGDYQTWLVDHLVDTLKGKRPEW